MSARIIDGGSLARAVRDECRRRVGELSAAGTRPGLAVVLVGEHPASRVYVNNKIKACAFVGLHSTLIEFPATAGEAELLRAIEALNAAPDIHGILVQLPLPAHLDAPKVLEAISRHKDVDGFHRYNVGALVVGNAVFPPCTPHGVLRLLDSEGIEVQGKNAVVIGASNIVGKPMALMLMQREATVTVCHARTQDLAQFTRLADILVVAAGKPGLVQAQMVKPGAVVIDVGINRLPDGRLVGDVDFEGVKGRASHITPVPGGVGPMTVSMLMVNTIESAARSRAKAAPVSIRWPAHPE